VVRETLYGKVHGDLLARSTGWLTRSSASKNTMMPSRYIRRLLALWITSMGTETNAMVADRAG
jgi:hypothetical protein